MRGLVAAVVALGLVLSLPSGERLTGAWGRWSFPPPPRYEDFVHLRPIEVTQTIGWRRYTRRVSYAQLLAGESLWADMHFGDWDRLPAAWRWPPLARLLRTGFAVTDAPDVWRGMTASDWDRVAQPVRAIAFLDMVEAWRACLEPGVEHDLAPAVVGTRLRAIAMAESWFDHRAVHVNGDDSLDLGIGQASAVARETLRQLHAAGAVDFSLTDEEYFEPLAATRALVFWFGLMLVEAQGDLDLATRAYNVGLGRALRGAGEEYLANVRRIERRYFAGEATSPTWSFLMTRAPLRPAGWGGAPAVLPLQPLVLPAQPGPPLVPRAIDLGVPGPYPQNN